ncbi:MAG: hypothetical protein GX902_01440 [Lentisphaerae bacterium]|nr:hypothetical protein [Lentisphaerota bacterium]
MSSDTHAAVVQKLIDLYHMLVCHNGFGEMSVDIRILKRGQKEVIIRCGKQFRFVVDTPGQGAEREEWLTNWKHDEEDEKDDAPAAAAPLKGNAQPES